MKIKNIAVACALLAACALAAEPAKTSAAKTGFPRQPDAARAALRAAVGKPFSSGWVFIEGKYIDPPYKVERFGNVIRINGIQVTGEVVPWSAFIRTQSGVKVTKSEQPADTGDSAAEAAPEPAVEEVDDSWESSLDDLFDDEPSAKKPAKKATPAYKPRPKKPTVTVTYSFDGEFQHNDKSKALLQKINALRTKIDSTLRQGGCMMFSTRYPMVSMDAGATRHIMDRLPDLMKQSLDRATFGQGVHSASMPFSEPVIDELFKNRIDYLRISNRVRKEKGSLW